MKPEEVNKYIKNEIGKQYRDDLKTQLSKVFGDDISEVLVNLKFYENLQKSGTLDPSMDRVVKDIKNAHADKMVKYSEVINNLDTKYDAIR